MDNSLKFYIFFILSFISKSVSIYLFIKYILIKVIKFLGRNIFLYDFKEINSVFEYLIDIFPSKLKKIPNFYLKFLDKYFISWMSIKDIKDFVYLEYIFGIITISLDIMLWCILGKNIFYISIFLYVVFILLINIKIVFSFKRRVAIFNKNLPYLIDNINLCLSSGMDIIQSLKEVSFKGNSLLHKEFMNIVKRIQIGYSFEESFMEVNTKCSEDLFHFIHSVKYALDNGADIIGTVSKISEDIKNKQIQNLESKAGEISVKMVFPMLLCIFPSVVSLMIGPMIVNWFLNM